MTGRHIKQAFINIYYNRRTSAMALLTMTAAMLLLGLSLLAIININQLTAKWNSIEEVTLYLDDDLTIREQEHLVAVLAELPEIKKAERVNPATSFQEFVALGDEAAQLVKGLDPAIFPPAILLSLNTFLVTTENFPIFVTTLRTIPGMSAIDYGQFEHEQVSSIAILVRVGTTFCALLVTMLMLFVVFNTIKVAVYNRHDEIEIQLLVGATPAFIKAPLLWEGFLIGLFSGLLACVLLSLSQIFLSAPINHLLNSVLPAFSISFYSPSLWPTLLLTGALMATTGTVLAVRRLQ